MAKMAGAFTLYITLPCHGSVDVLSSSAHIQADESIRLAILSLAALETYQGLITLFSLGHVTEKYAKFGQGE